MTKRAQKITVKTVGKPPLSGAAAFARLLTAVMLQNKLAKGKR